MAYYLAMIDQTTDAFGVVVPDCPGCYAMARSFEDAVAHATEALDGWMADRMTDGYAPPACRTIQELRADSSLAEDFAGGSVVALIPYASATNRALLDLDTRLLAQIDEAASRRGMTSAAFLAATLEKLAACG